jgi:hypothetical protein
MSGCDEEPMCQCGHPARLHPKDDDVKCYGDIFNGSYFDNCPCEGFKAEPPSSAEEEELDARLQTTWMHTL